jgi:hypothetical protein
MANEVRAAELRLLRGFIRHVPYSGSMAVNADLNAGSFIRGSQQGGFQRGTRQANPNRITYLIRLVVAHERQAKQPVRIILVTTTTVILSKKVMRLRKIILLEIGLPTQQQENHNVP